MITKDKQINEKKKMWKQIQVDGVELGTTGLKFLWNSESDANHFFFSVFFKTKHRAKSSENKRN